ncbi:MAG: hypothetical protein QMC89_02645 [Candidatus Hodarchaeaceae archaeon]|nr:hypothetical protein [Candidatus Hodarchaeaceae archaeon]
MPTRQLAVALGAAWLATALLGYGLVGGRRALAAATVLAAIAFVVLARPLPWLGEEGVEVEERPGFVAFRFSSSFTYEENGPGRIAAVVLDLPYPHIEGVPIERNNFDYGPVLKLLRGDLVQVEDGRVEKLRGGRTSAPAMSMQVVDAGAFDIFHKMRISVTDLLPDETVAVEGVFWVRNEYAANVSLMDNMDALHQYRPDQPPLTWANLDFQLQSEIPVSFLSRLERWDGAKWTPVEEWARSIPNIKTAAAVRLFEAD